MKITLMRMEKVIPSVFTCFKEIVCTTGARQCVSWDLLATDPVTDDVLFVGSLLNPAC